MVRLLGNLLVLLAFACFAVAASAACVAPPSQRDPARFGALTYALGPSLDGVYDWSQVQRAELAPHVRLLEGLGPSVALTSEGAADVVVRAGSLLDGACGAWRPGERFVVVDAACSSREGGLLAVARAINHELMHWWLYSRWQWSGHICAHPSARRDCHPSVTCRDCLLSPGLAQRDDGPSAVEAYTGQVAEPAPADGDLSLVRLCATVGRCQ